MEHSEWRDGIEYLVHRGGIFGSICTLEPYQTAFLRDRSTTRIVLKSRQIGFSWIFAAEALLHALLEDRSLSLFVSLNEREAQEKIRYAEALHQALPKRLQGRLLRASRDELEWENGSRILSFPCRAPRGFSGANVYLDELAFYEDDRAVYLGALPVISRGGRLTLASTPFGRRGVFWEQVGDRVQVTGDRENPCGYHEVPWWRCSWMVNDHARALLSQPDASADGGSLSPVTCTLSPMGLSPSERVERFGSERLKEIFAAMDYETFQQEYECRFLEEEDAFIPYAEIMPCVQSDLSVATDLSGLPEASGALYAGFDVGRSVHPSELVVIERMLEGTGVVRLMQTLRGTAFNEQNALLSALLTQGNLRRLSMDATGMGAPLAEEAARSHPLRVEPVMFTAALKERLAVGLKVALSRREIVLPPDRELIAQIRSIRRSFGGGGSLRFETNTTGEASKPTHADRFWSLALAWHAFQGEGGQRLAARRMGC